MLAIIDELILLISSFILIIGDNIEIRASTMYIIMKPFNIPHINPPAWLNCLMRGNLAIISPENLKKNRIIFEIIKTIIIQPI